MVDANALVYLRARYYHPGVGVFTGLDPVEGVNRYQYVGSNPTNFVDPSGMIMELPSQDNCYQQGDGIQSGCKICWLIWEDIYQNNPDFGLNWPYYLARFEQCLEKYACPPECHTYPYCRKPNIATNGHFGGIGQYLIKQWVADRWDAISQVCTDPDLAVDNIWTILRGVSTLTSLLQGDGLLPGVESIGVLISGTGIFQLFGLAGPSVGAGGMFLFNRSVNDCGLYLFDGMGGGVTLDPILDSQAIVFSTATLDQFSGGGVDFSFDFILLSGGISISNGCEATISIGLSIPDLPSGALVPRSYTSGTSCSKTLDAIMNWNNGFLKLR